MDKYEKYALILIGVVLIVFLLSIFRGVSKYSASIPETIPFDESYTKPRVEKIEDNVYQVFMLAQMWSFEPSEIFLPVGAEVEFFLTSKDVVHGFHINEKGLNMMAVPGAVNKTSFKFDKPGVYNMVCHEYCGSGHQQMHGEIIVNYPKVK